MNCAFLLFFPVFLYFCVFFSVLVFFSVFNGVLVLYSVINGVLVLYSVYKGVSVLCGVFKGVFVISMYFKGVFTRLLEGMQLRILREGTEVCDQIVRVSTARRVRFGYEEQLKKAFAIQAYARGSGTPTF